MNEKKNEETKIRNKHTNEHIQSLVLANRCEQTEKKRSKAQFSKKKKLHFRMAYRKQPKNIQMLVNCILIQKKIMILMQFKINKVNQTLTK